MPLLKNTQKQQKKENSAQQSLADTNRSSIESLKLKLEASTAGIVALKDTSLLETYERILAGFLQKMTDAPSITKYDAKEMDSEIERMIENGGTAMTKADGQTVKRFCTALKEYLDEMRVELTTSQLDKKDEILKQRQERVRNYRALIETSASAFNNLQNNKRQRQRREEMKEEFTRLMTEEKQKAEENPGLAAELGSFRPGVDKLSDGAQELLALRTKAEGIGRSYQSIRKTIEELEKHYAAMTEQLKTGDMILSNQVEMISEENMRQFRNMSELFKKQLLAIEAEIDEIEEVIDTFHKNVSAVIDTKESGEKMMMVNQRFEEMKAAHEQELNRQNQVEIDNTAKPLVLAQ